MCRFCPCVMCVCSVCVLCVCAFSVCVLCFRCVSCVRVCYVRSVRAMCDMRVCVCHVGGWVLCACECGVCAACALCALSWSVCGRVEHSWLPCTHRCWLREHRIQAEVVRLCARLLLGCGEPRCTLGSSWAQLGVGEACSPAALHGAADRWLASRVHGAAH